MVGAMAVEATQVAMAEADNRVSANRRALFGSGGRRGRGRGRRCETECFFFREPLCNILKLRVCVKFR